MEKKLVNPLPKVPTDFLVAKELAYDSLGMTIKNIIIEKESREYGSLSLELNDKRVLFRIGKVTPKKIGYFVTFWKRIKNGPILPYDRADPFEFLIVSVRKEGRLGQFIFPKQALVERGLVSENGLRGKLAFRLYAPWDIPGSSLSAKTQQWQAFYFLEIPFQTDKRQDLFTAFLD